MDNQTNCESCVWEDRQTDRQSDRHDRQTDRQTNRQTDRQTDRQTYARIDREFLCICCVIYSEN